MRNRCAGIFQDGTSVVDGVVDIPLPGEPILGLAGRNGDRDCHLGLDCFLAGPENRLVAPVVHSVLDDCAGGYNPIVLYGPTGTGKSHLARGFARSWKSRYRRRRVIYTSSPDYAREFADAVDTQALDEFRARFRKAALLVVEDFDRLAENRPAQEELIHTLDAVLADDRRVVVTARLAPAQIPGMIPALCSRLSAGLMAALAAPGEGTRLAVLRALAALGHFDLADTAARALADGLSGTVPELAEALLELASPAWADGDRIDATTVRRYLAGRHGSRRPALREIAAAAARFFSLKLSDLRSPSRHRAVVTARGVAMYVARKLTEKSLDEIGHYFGGRDHSTVMYGCRRIENSLQTDAAIREAVKRLECKWQAGPA